MKPQPVNNLPPAHAAYLLISIFISGAATLVLELVGTRVISPYYGSSLYCWSALITATLVSLAAGYALGGYWADRRPALSLFAALACAGGAAAAIVPMARIPLLTVTTPLGIKLGALASALLLIAPALVLLSALGPIAVKLTTKGVATVGKSAGNIYAVSTLGSVMGAGLTGFILIPQFKISHILYGVAVSMLLLGACGYLLASAKKACAGPAGLAILIAVLGLQPQQEEATNVLLNKESPYGQIKVMDFGGRRYLLVNGTAQSMAWADSLESDSQYAQGMEWAALLRPQAKNALVIGVGAGLLPGALEKFYGLTADSVDVDPGMVDAAKTYFGFSPKGRVFIEDGRTFLERSAPRYDLVFLDAFAAESPPYHLFTQESFSIIRRSLGPDGILAVNLVTMVHDRGGRPWLAALKTLRSVFPQVRAYLASDAYDDLANVVFFCSNAPLTSAGAAARARPQIRKNLEAMLARELQPSADSLFRATLMNDDHAPMEFLLAQTSARWREGLQKKVSSVLLY